jgi:hypothetical protein
MHVLKTICFTIAELAKQAWAFPATVAANFRKKKRQLKNRGKGPLFPAQLRVAQAARQKSRSNSLAVNYGALLTLWYPPELPRLVFGPGL